MKNKLPAHTGWEWLLLYTKALSNITPTDLASLNLTNPTDKKRPDNKGVTEKPSEKNL